MDDSKLKIVNNRNGKDDSATWKSNFNSAKSQNNMEEGGKFPKPWERQPGEKDFIYRAFLLYRDSEERSLEEVSQKISKRWLAYLPKWYHDWYWIDRAKRYDSFQKENNPSYHYELNDLSQILFSKIMEALDNISSCELKASDISRMIEVVSKLEKKGKEEIGEESDIKTSSVQIYLPSNGKEVL